MGQWRINLILFLLLAIQQIVAQEQKQIDSLTRTLRSYDNNKKQRGSSLSIADSTKVIILDQLANSYLKIDPDESLRYANKELELSKKISFRRGIGLAYQTLGLIHDFRKEYVPALKFYKESLNAGANDSDKTTIYISIGNIYGKQSNYPEALKFMLHGLALSKKSNDSYQIGRVYNNIGVLYKLRGKYDEALKSFFGALDIMEQVGDKSAMGMMYHNIGDIYMMQEKYDDAISYQHKGLEMLKQTGDKQGMSMCHNGLGLAYSGKGLYNMALENFNASLKINQESGNDHGIATTYLNMGRNYFLKGDMSQAEINAKKGLSLTRSHNDVELKMNAYELFSKIFEERKDYKRALESTLLYHELKDSVYNAGNDQRFSQLKVKYDLKSSQDSIAAIQAKKDILAKIALKSQKNTRNFVYIVLLIIVTFLIILVWQRNKIAIVKKQKALEQERNRISRELHDNLGAQLSTVRMFVSSLRNNEKGQISETVDNSIGLLDASIDELRGIMHEMQNPVLIEKGYLVATERLINKVNQLHSVHFALSNHKMEPRPRTELEHQLYRITQELVNNTLKYAKAKNVSIDILRRDGNLVLMYEDDGIGYDVNKIQKGYGLRNIEIRVKAVGGKVEFDSMPNTGARAIIEIPE